MLLSKFEIPFFTQCCSLSQLKTFPGCYETDWDYVGGDLSHQASIPSAEECQKRCGQLTECYYFTWLKEGEACYLKRKEGWTKKSAEAGQTLISGPKKCKMLTTQGTLGIYTHLCVFVDFHQVRNV